MLDLLIKGGRVADWKNHTDRILNLATSLMIIRWKPLML